MSVQPQIEVMSPPERLLREDLASASFMAGCDRDYWRLLTIEWPYAVIEIAAAPRPGSPEWWALRFDLSGYPQAPTACPWNLVTDLPLDGDRWPGGGRRILAAFNPDWRAEALYLPVDRLALEGHDVWREKHACYVWDAALDITQYLRVLHELLTDDSYAGTRG
jgi:hypothetical protein